MNDTRTTGNKVSVGPSGSGALSPRTGEEGDRFIKNLTFVAALAVVVALAALIG